MKSKCYIALLAGILAIGSNVQAGQTPEEVVRTLENAFLTGDAKGALAVFYFPDSSSQKRLTDQFTPAFFASYRTGWHLELLATKTTDNYAAVVVRPWVENKPKGKPDITPFFLIRTPSGWLLSPNLENPFDFRPLVGTNDIGQAELNALYEWTRQIRQQAVMENDK